MTNFLRILRLALTHRINVAACLASSLVVALLWAGNLSVVYTVVDVIMNDKSLPGWIDEQASQSRAKLAELDAQVVSLQSDPAQHRAELQEARRQQQLHLERAEKFEWLSPLAHRWLPNTPFETLVVICGAVMVGTLLKNVFRVLNALVVARLACSVGFELRKAFYQKLLRLDLAAFNEQGRGDLMNRCTSDLNSVSLGVQTLFGMAIREPLKMLACFAGAAYVSWRLLLLTILIVPPAAYLIRLLAKSLKRANRRAMEELSVIYETLTETLAGMKLIKAFTMEPSECERFGRSAKSYYSRTMRIAVYNSLVNPVTEVLGIAMVMLAAMAGGYLVLGERTHLFGLPISDLPLTHGHMSMFFAMLIGMSDPARRLSNVFNELQQAAAASDRVYEVLDSEPKIKDPKRPQPLPRLAQALRFEGVDFAYHPDEPVLRDIDLEVAAGETIAIVGPNGCGKSTLLALLPRFYEPAKGVITIDGVDISKVRLHDLRSRIGIVSQEALLFNDTVAANIAYGTDQLDQELIEAAARKAHAHEFIMGKLSDGYQTLVGPGGSRLSGGQRQRIALARAILRDPEILILDEATSQIDIESEQLIHDVLAEFTKGRTTFMITHRMSTISLADRVVVMDQGQIVDAGAHELLLARCDLYRRLFHIEYRESA